MSVHPAIHEGLRDAEDEACEAREFGPIKERGPWRAVQLSLVRVDIVSDDFEHDASLAVTGDFVSVGQRLAYAREIARRLNEWQECAE